MNVVKRISLDGLPELLDSALSQFRLGGPHSDVFFDDDFSPYVQLLADDGEPVPPYLFLGTETMLAKVFGRKQAMTAIGRRGFPINIEVPALNRVYQEVSTIQKPVADHITVRLLNEVYQYTRLTMPTKFGTGAPSFSVFVHHERTFRIPSLSANECR